MKIERLPLNALRAFAEAARTGSFKVAAHRLGVTPGAVSRQIRQLEDRFGVSLFERHANGVSVSRAGRLLAEDVNAGLARIANGVQMVTERSRETTTLVISAPPSFMQHWLLPRLNDFETQENDIEIALDADQKLTPPVWQEGSARLSMRYGRGPWRGVRTVPLFDDRLVPVCAPGLLEQSPIRTPEDLLHHQLLAVDWCSHQSGDFPGWNEWFRAAGVTITASPTQRQYSLYSLALDRAIAGQGVMLATYPVVADRLASGVLVRPLGDEYTLASSFTYDLLLPASGTAPPAVQRFVDWLVAEAQSFRQQVS
ncbi:LysR family transcriptional regulator [Marinobacter salarius]|jgi:LysR family glycine cleavage system transcriptional activator|uniref:LysR substrate-binding domain-containing protein n=1 Tax=Marinobacter TaxID=2742 RepID=UPI000C919892|nr:MULTISPECIES: LysR substrate-binding domain-containing protein [Marinobacter]MAB52230.1 LysR family transcriptional regulator [Marinobacter sp.]MCC4282529.1 LysR family transcriptional regulator [Marinobacter salarius]|tara:strand:- start:914 stop:1849 length:936 start_codon:yes stop_codon:yes gene_type:complete